MIFKLNRELKTKKGKRFPPGTTCAVEMVRDHLAVVVIGESRIGMPALSLSRYFDEFEEYTDEDLRGAMFDSICPSLLGYDVEPDGHDEHGFPSILLAAGLI